MAPPPLRQHAARPIAGAGPEDRRRRWCWFGATVRAGWPRIRRRRTTFSARSTSCPARTSRRQTRPRNRLGAGAQLLSLSAAGGRRSGRFEGFLASDGRWWCYTSILGPREGEPPLPDKKVSAVANAPARLGRTAGARADAPEGAPRDDGSPVEGTETNVQIVWPGKERASLRPRRLASAVVERFVVEMKPLSPACAGR